MEYRCAALFLLCLLSFACTSSSSSTETSLGTYNPPQTTNIDEAEWQSFGTYFDTVIYPRVTDKFESPEDIDGNGQIVILFSNLASEGTGGYFYPGDFFADEVGSNQMEILYINSLHKDIANEIIAHEFLHLVNFSNRYRVALDTNAPYQQMDTWMNEGIAEAAAHYAKDEVLSDHITRFNLNALRNGYPLVSWGNTVNDYTQAYLFFQYLKNQAPSREGIFTPLIRHEALNYESIEAVMAEENASLSTFPDILKGFTLANLVGASSGLYGYGDEASDFSLNTPKSPSAIFTSNQLDSGGYIYLYPSDTHLSTFQPTTIGEDVRFYKINNTATPLHSAVENLSIPELSFSALIAVNTSGDAEAGLQALGDLPNSDTLPSSVQSSQPNPLLFKLTNSEAKTKALCGQFAPRFRPYTQTLSRSMAPNASISHENTTHQFYIVSNFNDLTFHPITATLKYGDETTKCLIYAY